MRPLPSSDRTPARAADVLENPARQRVVDVLARQEGPIPVTMLVDEFLVGVDAPLDGTQLPGTRRHLYAVLDARHLPALADAGLVYRDPVADTVELIDAGRRADRSQG